MSARDALRRLRGAPASAPAGAPAPLPEPPTELVARRAELARQFADLQWDLGGLAYEMAIRDYFKLDVLARKAAELQVVDAELGELDRLLRTTEGVAGACTSCGAPHSRGAAFCWSCGTMLRVDVPVATNGHAP